MTKVIKPINVTEHMTIRAQIEAGTKEAVCTYCKESPCYQLSAQDKYLVKTYLYDEKNLICTNCWNFFNKNGRLITHILRKLIKINILQRGARKWLNNTNIIEAMSDYRRRLSSAISSFRKE